jgi:hypothetical protein
MFWKFCILPAPPVPEGYRLLERGEEFRIGDMGAMIRKEYLDHGIPPKRKWVEIKTRIQTGTVVLKGRVARKIEDPE